VNRKLRIVMFSRVLPHHAIGGMQAIAWDLARHFAAAGSDVTIVTSQIAGYPSEFVDAGVSVRAIAGTDWRRSGRKWWNSTLQVFREELWLRCDILLSISAAGFGLLPVRQCFAKIPFVMQAHGTSIGELVSKIRSPSLRSIISSGKNIVWLFKDLLAYRKFDAVVGVGPVVVGRLSRFPYSSVVSKSSLVSIPNGVDADLFRPDERARSVERSVLGIASDERVVVSASRLHKQKGVALGLAAFAVLAKTQSNLRYLIAGDGPERKSLNIYADSLGIADRVHFLGAISRERLASILRACDVMVFTSTRIEGLALNVLEALACGIPAVISRHLFDRAAFRRSVWPVSPEDPGAVADAMSQALNMPRSLNSLLPQGYTLNECSRAYLNLFQDLVARLD
jgi:glycosyltransferase involved in cell wall biosynthesis